MQVKSIAECSKGSILQIFSTFIKLTFIMKTFVLSIFEWPFYTGITVHSQCRVTDGDAINSQCVELVKR